MSKEKQIEELTYDIANMPNSVDCIVAEAEYLYAKGYRKQSEGHWFIQEYEYFTCSECGDDYPNGCDTTAEAKEMLKNGEYPNYCPKCGAKMKGGAE